MKPNWYHLMILILGIVAFSCDKVPTETVEFTEPLYRLAKLYFESSDGEIAVTNYHYDLNGHNYMAVWHLDDSSRSSMNYHTLDSAGRMLVKSREFSDSIRTVQHYRYDGSGNLLWEDFDRSDGVKGEVDYVYDESGRLEYADCRGLNGWFHGRIEYTWEADIKTGADLIQDSQKTGSIVYEYENDLLVEEVWDFPGKWNQVFRHEYHQATKQTFTSPNVFIRENPWFRVASEYYEFDGESGGPSYYTYDESGKMTAKEFIRSDGLTTKTTYEYDSAGLLDLSMREYGDGRTTDFLYWYSVDRKLLVKTFQWSDEKSGSETYRYEDGKLVKGEYVAMDGWLNGDLNFEYDGNALIKNASFKGKDGFDAELEFSYDLDFNLVKIHWELTSGNTQTYYFDYEPFHGFY